MRLGVVGYNAENGHPFSFSAIVNGFSDSGFAESGWPVIHKYLRARDPSEFGIADARVTHAWTQDPKITKALCRACLIPQAVERLDEMLGVVDGLLICRHDHETHAAMALPFLKAGVPVFVDKPLSLDTNELRMLQPYVERGQLMSCSGLRFAREMDEVVADLKAYGPIRLVRAAVVLDWEKYGIHMIDAALRLAWAQPTAVMHRHANHDSFGVEMDDGSLLQIDALGAVPKVFRLEVFGADRQSSHDLHDNFTAFRRTIWHFVDMARTGKPPIPPATTLSSLRILIAGRRARVENRPVRLDEVVI